MKPVMDPQLIWFTYDGDEPIAMWLNLPDINQLFKPLNGKFRISEKLRFALRQKWVKVNKVIGIIYGIIPEYQKTGVDYYMIVEAEKVFRKTGRYQEIELLWQGDFNPKIMAISQNLGAVKSRNLITYRLMLDKNLKFSRHPYLD